MGEKITFNPKLNIVLVYKSENFTWEDRTGSILAIFSAFYYGNFTGYDVYFKGGDKKFFYPFEKIKILKFIKDVPLNQKDIFVEGVLIQAEKLELFEEGYFKIKTQNKSIVTNQISFKSSTVTSTFQYFNDLSKYAGFISKDDEPLHYLSKNYEKMEYSQNAVLFNYLEGKYLSKKSSNDIYVPFSFNQSQHHAIENALNYSFSVIEGPPGTGKTQTILNLISNIIIQGKNCAVVSNNNTAIENIFDKLKEEDIEFIAAKLGRSDNVEKFFDGMDHNKLKNFILNFKDQSQIQDKTIHELTQIMKRLQEIETNVAKLQNELNNIEVEYNNYKKQLKSTIAMNENLKSDAYLKLMYLIETPKKIGFFKKLSIKHTFKINIDKLDLNEVFKSLSHTQEIFFGQKILTLSAKT
jgi:hypothetical protein